MKVISYAGGDYLTGDDIAIALLELSRGLANAEASQTVEIPILQNDGSRGTATFLVGPASQIVAVDTKSEFDELVDEDAVAHLKQVQTALNSVARTQSEREPTGWADADDI
ncbi:MAG: hypothetical protein Q7T17_14465 [Microbacterium sp.]|uniref:hypothetical protein n=1 Tax=Microbacterium sp. TaxID=51671 RepID=UPI0027283684|nr:hypothetical protein [Microbacterium sp.]MDO8384168.1 hypothetical protein [Microbacterium sp.]